MSTFLIILPTVLIVCFMACLYFILCNKILTVRTIEVTKEDGKIHQKTLGSKIYFIKSGRRYYEFSDNVSRFDYFDHSKIGKYLHAPEIKKPLFGILDTEGNCVTMYVYTKGHTKQNNYENETVHIPYKKKIQLDSNFSNNTIIRHVLQFNKLF